MKKTNSLFFSLTDWAQILKRGKTVIVLSGLICASLVFIYAVTRPVHFTAEGIFKGQFSQNANSLFKALEFLGVDESYSSSEDPRTFLRSYPVMQRVVESLHLQALVAEKPLRWGRVREIWHTLKTAQAYSRLKQERPPSAILASNVYVAGSTIIPDYSPTLQCTDLSYAAETSSALRIHFLDATTFKVLQGSHLLGKGALDTPFLWEKGSFTLSGKGAKRKKVSLHLIPLREAIQSLQRTIKITRDTENLSLIHVCYTHRNRQLACNIVNETMEQFQNYLKLEGKKKITKQLSYLRQRQEETMEQLEAMLEKQKDYFENHIDSGVILSLEKELEFMAATQAEKRQKLLDIQSEMMSLSKGKLPFAALLDQLKDEEAHTTLQALSVESAHDMIRHHQQELDILCLDKERYEYCLTKLSEADFDCSSLANILKDPSLHARLEKMHTLHHRLIDERNWSLKEREQLKVELETEKTFMQEHIQLLAEGTALHTKTLQGRIEALHHNLLFLLANRHAQELSTLAALGEQAKHFPTKWLNEQKIELNAKLYKEIIEAITKMIEAKNIGYNLDYLLSTVIQPASPPVLPNHPQLLKKGCTGALAGILCVCFGLCLYGIWLGPTASVSNLTSAGKPLFPQPDPIPLLTLALGPQQRVVLLTARHSLTFAAPLIDWLHRKGERVLLINLTAPSTPYLEGHDREAFLGSTSFQAQLAADRDLYDRIVILSVGDPQAFEAQALFTCADAVVYEINGELLKDLDPLPTETLYLMQEEQTPRQLPLQELGPPLERLFTRMKNSSFSAAKDVLGRSFPSMKS